MSRDGSSASRDRTTIRFSADPALDVVGNPTCPSSSSLRIVAGSYDTGEIALPCTGWVPSGRRARGRPRRRSGYRYGAGSDGVGGVRKLSVGDGRLNATLTGPLHLPIPTGAPFVEVRLVLGGSETCGRLQGLSPDGTTTFFAFGPSTACTAMPPRPNFLVVYLDDTRVDGVDLMPVVQTRLVGEGHDFTNAFTPNAICCPSRASVLTGLYSFHHGTRALTGPIGGAHRFRELGSDRNTIAVWLKRAGYRTGLFGKYLNGYDAGTEGGLGPNGGLYVPPGWDRWWAMVSPELYGGQYGSTYKITQEDGSLLVFDDHTSDAQYATDLGAAEVRDFVTAAVGAGQPFFAYWAPIASHTDGLLPPAPAARHLDLFLDLPPWRPPSWNEVDRSDKPRWMTALRGDPLDLTSLYRSRAYESLLAVDEQLGAFLDLVDSLGVADDTVIVFTSDNGVTWGEHGMFFQAKGCAYEECQRVPFIARYPRLGATASTHDQPVLNLDVAPTLAALAGVALTTAVDGESLVPLLAGGTPPWRTDYLLESARTTCNDSLSFSALPADGDQVRLFYGDPWAVSPRASVVFEFDAGDGVTAPGTTLVPIQATIGAMAGELSQTVTATVPGVRHVPNFFGVALVEDATTACNAPFWWEEVDLNGVIKPKNPAPAYFGVRDVARGYTWVEYETGERELYDLNVDPDQLESRHADPDYATLRAELSARTAALRTH
jgi:arylsulfatase A-like enzyme